MTSTVEAGGSGGRPATGSIVWADPTTKVEPVGVRVTKADGRRVVVPFDPGTSSDDARLLAPVVAERARHAVGQGSGQTVSEYVKLWLVDREARGLSSVRDDRSRMTHHVLPLLGHLDAQSFGRTDVERLRDVLDRRIVLKEGHAKHLSWRTAANIWTLVTSMCDDMVSAKHRELRVRDDNPTRDVRPPERGATKAKQFLYPSEFLTFVSCERIPVPWRRAVALAIYTFARDGELRALRWDGGDIDLSHAALSITRAWSRTTGKEKSTKTGDTRRFALEANLVPLLKAMHAEKKGKGKILGLNELHMARPLRRFLKRAGITRPELHHGSPTRKPLTWHDLRATGATWMAVRGDDPLKIKQRCGHATFSTTEGYIREAENLREGFGDVFPPLPESLIHPPKRPRKVSASVSAFGVADPTAHRKNKDNTERDTGFEPA